MWTCDKHGVGFEEAYKFRYETGYNPPGPEPEPEGSGENQGIQVDQASHEKFEALEKKNEELTK